MDSTANGNPCFPLFEEAVFVDHDCFQDLEDLPDGAQVPPHESGAGGNHPTQLPADALGSDPTFPVAQGIFGPALPTTLNPPAFGSYGAQANSEVAWAYTTGFPGPSGADQAFYNVPSFAQQHHISDNGPTEDFSFHPDLSCTTHAVNHNPVDCSWAFDFEHPNFMAPAPSTRLPQGRPAPSIYLSKDIR
ncbi:uncharacterized protein B0I36DRAFT_368056 [Microdochium trichocladiopsis]|uniref:Uncharacterized protein n=1 Tax=Microdochium trichocladiopsis TaxID=1682393 RepID=A0A9P9BJE1_9PEZI|nr:uncharacterized protein B0I36DRAFT_368056 [Microdochium trichocladiopsis]KAH7018000.1 hypothetical protein B0I36DRAFT_368056 [Microdochium trichocladiopsis]